MGGQKDTVRRDPMFELFELELSSIEKLQI